jgi:hypothetical protein
MLVSIWDDPGHRYLWSEEAHQVLLDMGIENTVALIQEVSDRYKDMREREEVRNPRGLAKTILRRKGIDALRQRQRAVLVPMEQVHLEIAKEHLVADDDRAVPPPSEDEVLDQIRSIQPERELEERHEAQEASLKQMGEELGKWLLRPSDPVVCELHEDGCPHPHNVLAISQAVVYSLLNELIEQESWSGRQKKTLKPHQRRTSEEWERRLYQRLQGLASVRARDVNSVLYGDTAGGRQARSRAARCVLRCLWFEARSAKFWRFAELAAITVGWVYAQQLARAGIAQSTRRRLHAWLTEYQPTRHSALGCTPTSCPAIDLNTGHISPANEGDLT